MQGAIAYSGRLSVPKGWFSRGPAQWSTAEPEGTWDVAEEGSGTGC